MPNAELLRATLVAVEADPAHHYQDTYRCKSGMCFAGFAAQLAGGEWAFPDLDQIPDTLERSMLDLPASLLFDPATDEAIDIDLVDTLNDGRRVVHTNDRAQVLLGISDVEAMHLFSATNRVEQLKLMVDALCDTELSEEDRKQLLSKIEKDPRAGAHSFGS